MYHAYSITTTFDAIRQWVCEFERADNLGNLSPQTGVYPDLMSPIIRNQAGFRQFVKMRWGMPTSSQALYQAAKKRALSLINKGQPISHDEFPEMIKVEPDRGTHNVRNTSSPHWQRWLAPEFRCVVPFTSFAEFDNAVGPDGKKKGNTWFAYDVDRPARLLRR
jgi:putative SOS response-associated peptidase YedK